MKAVVSPVRIAGLPVRCLAGVLSAVMVASPVQALGAPVSETVHKAASGTKSKTTKAKATAKTSTTKGSSKRAVTKKALTKRAPARRRSTARSHRRSSRSSIADRARTARMRRAFVASTELRPMAQQLANMRTPEAYAGVTAYARRHTGEAAAAAYLALGHAYLLDKRYAEAAENFSRSRKAGDDLADYADYLGAQASHSAGDDAAAAALLRGFADRYPDSVFDDDAPELEANVLLAMNDAEGARRVLTQAKGTAAAEDTGFQLAEGQVAYALGLRDAAGRMFKQLLLSHPLSQDAQVARARLTEMGLESSLTAMELRGLGDAYYRGGRYNEAADQYQALLRIGALSEGERNSVAVAAAACDLKLKKLTTAQAEALADTNDENGARRLYLQMELARDRDNTADQQRIVAEMQKRFPSSPWLAEALFSSGNMYLLKKDYSTAAEYYGALASSFPESKNAPAAHWRAGWLNYRQRLYPEAARLFDDQINQYPAAAETVGALYWRGRLYESQDHAPARAAANYRAIVRVYGHYFYAQMARARLAELGNTQPAPAPQLDRLQVVTPPLLMESFPEESPHLAKARLLANSGLTEYIAREIKADPDSHSWSSLAEAQIYTSYGETFRALRAMKRALPYAASAPLKSIPLAYWRILFPEPYWDTIKAESAKNHLDPYLVASLIRQESEFNASVVSYANAWGLMQLLPSVGKQMAREEGIRNFQTFQLLDPEMNIRLGTRYLRQMLDSFGGVQEYALAAYNAGGTRVTDWQAAGPYQGMDEFVESIPFTQTREYVEAIIRNVDTYRAIDEYARSQGRAQTSAER